MTDKKLLSIIVPVYNEQEVINQFYKRLVSVLNEIEHNFEIIFVDDGSHDQTPDILSKIVQMNRDVKIVTFSRNFGHMIALSAGLDHAAGDAVITIDSDLQHPPELVPELVKQWEKGTKVVNTIREGTRGISRFKRLSVRIFYRIINKITDIEIHPNSADFRLLDKEVVNVLKGAKERTRFMRGLVGWLGYKQEFIAFKADSRQAGKTKYSFFRMFSFAIDGITSFSSLPLRMATYLGLVIAFFSSIYIIYTIYIKLSGQSLTPGWASVLVAILFMGGVQLIFLGIIGEYLYRIYEETKKGLYM